MINIEQKWQKIWEEEQAFATTNDSKKPKYYVLEMLPYPSGKIHVGHLRNYSIGDCLARFMTAQGYNVLHPMGWDAFGLPAENAAINHSSHPAKWTYDNIKTMRDQLKSIGFSYDWSREVTTCDPDYYKHEQKFFLELYAKNLAYQKESLVNWDPVDNTVLANEQVVDGRGWRSGALVEKRHLKQWFLRITNYAEELLNEIPKLTGWPDSVKSMQEKWIGKSQGANFAFKIKDYDHSIKPASKLATAREFEGNTEHRTAAYNNVHDDSSTGGGLTHTSPAEIEFGNRFIEVFSTRPETIFGASYLAVAYNHPIIEQLVNIDNKISSFIKQCSHLHSTSAVEKAEKDGVFTNLSVTHPFDPNITLPVIITNFVLMDYGTGAVFGCPAHDERDYELAKKLGLPIKQVVKADDNIDLLSSAYTGDGIMINSDFLNGLTIQEAKERVIDKFEKLAIGKRTINYRLKDWGVSRQRFWGCPIPIIYCDNCGILPVPEKDLPVTLPEDVKFNEYGNPLDSHPNWKHTTCPKCQKPAIRETDTFDTFFESSWYFTRYCNAEAKDMVNKNACNYWLPIDQYIGGIEHAVMHLLYARFFTKVMNEQGYLSVREPFKNLLTQGMVLHATFKDQNNNWLYPDEVEKRFDKWVSKTTGQEVVVGRVEKMSKSKKNVVDLESILTNHSADSIRLFVLSNSPPEKDFEWSSAGLEGCFKFINRLSSMADTLINKPNTSTSSQATKLIRFTHFTIKHVTEELKEFKLNKAIARMRELFNALSEELMQQTPNFHTVLDSFNILMQLLNPFIPHITEEIWQKLVNQERLYKKSWPSFEENLLVENSYTIAMQINGKLRATYEFPISSTDDEIKSIVTGLESIQKHLDNKEPKKIIIVPKKIVNIVV